MEHRWGQLGRSWQWAYSYHNVICLSNSQCCFISLAVSLIQYSSVRWYKTRSVSLMVRLREISAR